MSPPTQRIPARMSRRRELLVNLALAFGVSAGLLTVCEGTARFFERPEDRPRTADTWVPAANDDHFYTLKRRPLGWPRSETNADGLRDRAHSEERPEDVWRVAVLGDSVTEGFGLSWRAGLSARARASARSGRRARRGPERRRARLVHAPAADRLPPDRQAIPARPGAGRHLPQRHHRARAPAATAAAAAASAAPPLGVRSPRGGRGPPRAGPGRGAVRRPAGPHGLLRRAREAAPRGRAGRGRARARRAPLPLPARARRPAPERPVADQLVVRGRVAALPGPAAGARSAGARCLRRREPPEPRGVRGGGGRAAHAAAGAARCRRHSATRSPMRLCLRARPRGAGSPPRGPR